MKEKRLQQRLVSTQLNSTRRSNAEERLGELLVVVGVGHLVAALVLVGVHLADAVGDLIGRQVDGELVARYVGALTVLRQRLERVDHVGHRRDVVRLAADHERHVVLEVDEAVAVRIDQVEDALEDEVGRALVGHGQIVAESAQARLELVVVEAAALLAIEVLEHHGELAQRLLGHARLIARLYLLLQVVNHAHAELVELVPRLGETQRAVLGVFVVEDEALLEQRAELLDAAELLLDAAYLLGLLLGGDELRLERARYRADLHHVVARVAEPRVEGARQLRELLPQRVVLLLALLLDDQVGLAVLDRLVQRTPRVAQRVHGEPRVRVGPGLQRLDALVELLELAEVDQGRVQSAQEALVGARQLVYFVERVAAHRVGEVLLGVLEPRVERGRLLGEQQVQVVQVAVLGLGHLELRAARVTRRQQCVPAFDHLIELVLDAFVARCTSHHKLTCLEYQLYYFKNKLNLKT